TARAAAAAEGTDSGSRTTARSIQGNESRNAREVRTASSSAPRVFPTPPGPRTVSNRVRWRHDRAPSISPGRPRKVVTERVGPGVRGGADSGRADSIVTLLRDSGPNIPGWSCDGQHRYSMG